MSEIQLQTQAQAVAEAPAPEVKDANIELIMPTLSLDSMDSEVVEKMEVKDAEAFRMQQFSEEEVKQINDFAEKIDLNDSNLIISYGAGAQQRLANFSDEALAQMRNKDMNEIGPLLSGLVADLKYDPEEKQGLFKDFFNKKANKAEAMKAHYSKVETNIESIAAKLEAHQQTLLKDIATQDKLYENNKIYFKELTMYIAAGKVALKKAQEETLPALKAKAQETGLAEDAQAVTDYASMCERFEKKLHDLDLTRTVCLQNAPQIRLVQSNAIILSDKIHSTLVNTLPMWKNQLVITMGLAHSQEAIKAQRMVTDTTNDILKKNAELLHQSTVEVATENERGIVDMETLKHTNEELIATIDDLLRIQNEGREKRQQAELELANIESQLKAKMLEAGTR